MTLPEWIGVSAFVWGAIQGWLHWRLKAELLLLEKYIRTDMQRLDTAIGNGKSEIKDWINGTYLTRREWISEKGHIDRTSLESRERYADDHKRLGQVERLVGDNAIKIEGIENDVEGLKVDRRHR